MRELTELIGNEHELGHVNKVLRTTAQAFDAPVVGALHITCADESEWECIDSFQQEFVEHLLPEMKHAHKAPFRLSNLGARYEEGAIRVAEHHYATRDAQRSFKVMVVKVNGHVAVENTPDGPRFGPMQRYDTKSVACGALHALLDGGDKPFLRELRETFNRDNCDRLTLLGDEQHTEAQYRSLYVAILGAGLQAQRAVDEILDYEPASPTVYLVVSCVTFNRPGRDTELVCGCHTIDTRTDPVSHTYDGLGDNPGHLDVHCEFGSVRVLNA